MRAAGSRFRRGDRRDRGFDRGRRSAGCARWHKKFIDRLADPAPLSAGESDESYDCFDTGDFQLGSEAFRAKTRPVFKGR